MLTKRILLGIAAVAIYFSAYATFSKTNWSFLHLTKLAKAKQEEIAKTKNRNAIQVALLLDTSSSMSGLIEQAKSQLWNILNELARTKRNGEETTLEMALYEYGNPGKSTQANQINQLTPFTTDMDLISEVLFSLGTSGGEEYCGAVIQTALQELEWTSDEALKLIYIAGNEGFDQGPISFYDACKDAKVRGIMINTIFCGRESEGIKTFWKSGALAGGGDFLNIDHNEATTYVQTPYDDQINQLNTRLNNTYIPFGNKGKQKKENQMIQDSNAGSYSQVNAADRAVFKSSKKYKATDWDLVDAYKKDKKVIQEVKVVDEKLKELSVEELEAKIQQVTHERTKIQEEIRQLDKKRRQYKAKKQTNDDSSLQKNMIQNIQKQAELKGYKINN